MESSMSAADRDKYVLRLQEIANRVLGNKRIGKAKAEEIFTEIEKATNEVLARHDAGQSLSR
jgi:hypothetical protein